MKPLEHGRRELPSWPRRFKPPSGKGGASFAFRTMLLDVGRRKRPVRQEAIRSQKPLGRSKDRKNEARQALERLANELHDPMAPPGADAAEI